MKASTADSRNAALDGLRGLAILMVILFHYDLHDALTNPLARVFNRFASCGGAGVNLFFVLSGFLITGILLDTKNDARYLRNFFGRRLLRIFPLYYGTLFVGLILLPLLHPISDLKYLSTIQHQIWLWTYCSNIYESLSGRALPLFGHFWSLAVEEHFYLIWPFVVFWASRKVLLGICISCFFAAFAVRFGLLAAGADPALAVLRLTPCQLDGLAAGAFLALQMRQPGYTSRSFFSTAAWLFALSALLVAAPILGIPLFGRDAFSMALSNSIFAVLFGSLLILAVVSSPSFPLRRFLEMSWLRTLGRYSYALYVFHWPIGRLVLVVMERRWGMGDSPSDYTLSFKVVYFAIAFGLSLLAAWLSWNLYERHFLKLKRFFNYQEVQTGNTATRLVPLQQFGPS